MKGVALAAVLTCLQTTIFALPSRVAGTYGLFPDGRVRTMRGQITVTATGAFSGKVDLGRLQSVVYGDPQSGQNFYAYSVLTPISGQFNAQGGATLILRESTSPYNGPETLHLRYVQETPPFIRGTHSDGDSRVPTISTFAAYKVGPSGHLAGVYTLAFQAAASTGEEAPEGTGWAALTVKPSGRVLVRGRLATGAPFSTTSLLRAGGEFWFDADHEFVHSYQRAPEPVFVAVDLKENLSGLLTVKEDAPESDIEGALRWSYEKRHESHQREVFFYSDLRVKGSRYTPPAPGELIFDFPPEIPPNSDAPIEATLAGGGLPELQTAGFSLVLRVGVNRAVNLTPPLTAMQFNVADVAATGVIGGTFRGEMLVTGDTKRRSVSGVVLQKQNIGVGFFEGPESHRQGTGTFMMVPVNRQQQP
jgi:hypothetical protein